MFLRSPTISLALSLIHMANMIEIIKVLIIFLSQNLFRNFVQIKPLLASCHICSGGSGMALLEPLMSVPIWNVQA